MLTLDLDPVLLCNELGFADIEPSDDSVAQGPSSGIGSGNKHRNIVTNCGRTSMSIKESVRIAQSNNFMGLVCTSRLLDLVPALVSSVKEAGLVLISDYSHDGDKPTPSLVALAKGIDGLLMKNAVLRFKEAIDS